MESRGKNNLESFNEVVPPIKLKSFTILKSVKNVGEDHLRILIALVALFYDFLDDPSLSEKVLDDNDGVNDQVFKAYYSHGIQMSKKIEKANRILEEGGIKPENVLWARGLLADVKGDAFQAQNPVTEAVNNIYNYLVSFIIYYQNHYPLETTKRFHMNRNAKQKHEKSARPPSKNLAPKITHEEEPPIAQSVVKQDSSQNTRPPSTKRNITSDYTRSISSRDYKKKLGLGSVKASVPNSAVWAPEKNISTVSRKTTLIPQVNYNFPELKDSAVLECKPQRSLESIQKDSVVFSNKFEGDCSPAGVEMSQSMVVRDQAHSPQIAAEPHNDSQRQSINGSHLPSAEQEDKYQLALPYDMPPRMPLKAKNSSTYSNRSQKSDAVKVHTQVQEPVAKPQTLIPLSPIHSKLAGAVLPPRTQLRRSLPTRGVDCFRVKNSAPNAASADAQKEIDKIRTAIKVYNGDKGKTPQTSYPVSASNASKVSLKSSAFDGVKPRSSFADLRKPRLSLRPGSPKNFSEIQSRVKAKPVPQPSKSIETRLFKSEIASKAEAASSPVQENSPSQQALNPQSSYSNMFSELRPMASFSSHPEAARPPQVRKPQLSSRLPKSTPFLHRTPSKPIRQPREPAQNSVIDAKDPPTEEGLTIKNPRKEPKKWNKVPRSLSVGKVPQTPKSPTLTNPNSSINLHAKSVIKTYIDNQHVRLSYFNDQREEKIQKRELNKVKIEMGHYKFLVEREAAQKVKSDMQEKLKVNNYYVEFMEKYKNYAHTKAQEDKDYYSQIKDQAKAKQASTFEESHTNIGNVIFAHKVEESRPSLGEVFNLSAKGSTLFDADTSKSKHNGDIYKEYIALKRDIDTKELEKKKSDLQEELDYFKKLFAKNSL